MIPDLAIQSCSSTTFLFSMRGSVDLRYLHAMQRFALYLIGASVPATSTSSSGTTSRNVRHHLGSFPPLRSRIHCVHPKVQP